MIGSTIAATATTASPRPGANDWVLSSSIHATPADPRIARPSTVPAHGNRARARHSSTVPPPTSAPTAGAMTTT